MRTAPSREAASLALGDFPYVIVFGEPIEFEAEVKYPVRHSPRRPGHKASGRRSNRKTVEKFSRVVKDMGVTEAERTLRAEGFVPRVRKGSPTGSIKSTARPGG